MTSKLTSSRWLTAIRRVVPAFLRNRHYASINQSSRAVVSKMEPIAKTVAEAGRNAGASAD